MSVKIHIIILLFNIKYTCSWHNNSFSILFYCFMSCFVYFNFLITLNNLVDVLYRTHDMFNNMLHFVALRPLVAISEDVLLSKDEFCLTPWHNMEWHNTNPVSSNTRLTPWLNMEWHNTNPVSFNTRLTPWLNMERHNTNPVSFNTRLTLFLLLVF